MTTDPTHHAATSVGLLEDHHVVREALARALGDAGFSVRFAVGTATELLSAIEHDPVDVLLFDLSIRGSDPRDGVTLLGAVHESHPSAQLLVLTGSETPELAAACMSAGAAGYVLKSEVSSQAIIEAVGAAARGERRMPFRSVSDQGGLSASRPVGREPGALAQLTHREREVLACIGAGHDNLRIAALLGVAERTVKAHVSALYRKLGADNRVQLALVARRSGTLMSGSSQLEQ